MWPGTNENQREEGQKGSKKFAGKTFCFVPSFRFVFAISASFEATWEFRTTELTWNHFVAWAVDSYRVDRRKSARGLPSTARDRQIDQRLTPFPLNFLYQLNFQFFLLFERRLRILSVQKFISLLLLKFWCRNVILNSGNSHGHIDDAFLVLAAACCFFLSRFFASCFKPLSRLLTQNFFFFDLQT